MIKINLLGEEVRRDSSAALWLAGMAVSYVGFLLVATFLYFDISNQLTIREQEVLDLERQLAQLKEKTKEVSSLEAKRKELSSKLAIIAELKLNKFGPVRVLDDLNLSLPERAWLTGVSEKGNTIVLSGFALDGQTVAGFMDQLEKSDYFGDVKVETRATTHEGVKIQKFTLTSKLSYAGSLKSKPETLLSSPGDEEA